MLIIGTLILGASGNIDVRNIHCHRVPGSHSQSASHRPPLAKTLFRTHFSSPTEIEEHLISNVIGETSGIPLLTPKKHPRPHVLVSNIGNPGLIRSCTPWSRQISFFSVGARHTTNTREKQNNTKQVINLRFKHKSWSNATTTQATGRQKLREGVKGLRRKVLTWTKILSYIRNLSTFWMTLGKKGVFLGQKQCFSGKKCTITWYMLQILLS